MDMRIHHYFLVVESALDSVFASGLLLATFPFFLSGDA
jgi:hypothetical protein